MSIFVLTDGKTALPLAPARDYKRLHNGNDGPNTGGMGTFSPSVGLPDGLVDWTVASVVHPVLDVLRADAITYRGFIYVGLILTEDGPIVLEFNSRLGDPETQVVLPRLNDDLLGLLAATAAGELHGKPLSWLADSAVDVVVASRVTRSGRSRVAHPRIEPCRRPPRRLGVPCQHQTNCRRNREQRWSGPQYRRHRRRHRECPGRRISGSSRDRVRGDALPDGYRRMNGDFGFRVMAEPSRPY